MSSTRNLIIFYFFAYLIFLLGNILLDSLLVAVMPFVVGTLLGAYLAKYYTELTEGKSIR